MLYIRISIIGCLLPCTKTKIRTVYINEKVFDRRNISRVELIFSRSVKRKIYSFPQFNFFTFLTSIGGTAGLWLGLGIIQVSEYVATFMNPRMKILLRKSKKWPWIISSFFNIFCLLFNIFGKKMNSLNDTFYILYKTYFQQLFDYSTNVHKQLRAANPSNWQPTILMIWIFHRYHHQQSQVIHLDRWKQFIAS